MHDKQSDRFVDELLDASLKQFRGDEPCPGLEGRILATVRAREEAVRRGIWTWVWALGAAAGALAVAIVVVSLAHRQRVPIPATTSPAAPLAATKPAAPLIGPQEVLPTPRLTQRAARVRVAARRPDVFPTPVPLTEQEKLLLAFVQAVPKSQLPAVMEQTREIEIPDLNIAALDIKPLPGPTDGQEEK
jgi:hypothetical protein